RASASLPRRHDQDADAQRPGEVAKNPRVSPPTPLPKGEGPVCSYPLSWGEGRGEGMALRESVCRRCVMHPCETCQPQLLNYLYELLDEDERRAIEAHLQTCADCRAALVDARQQQEVLRAATRTSFPDVRFTPPALRISSSAKPEPQPRRRAWEQRWRRWAVAACIALLACGGVAFGVYCWPSHRASIDAAPTRPAA